MQLRFLMSLNVLGIELWKVSADVFSCFFSFIFYFKYQTEWQNMPSAPLVVCGDLKPRLVQWRPSFDFWSVTRFNSERHTKPNGVLRYHVSCPKPRCVVHEYTRSWPVSPIVLGNNVCFSLYLVWDCKCTGMATCLLQPLLKIIDLRQFYKEKEFLIFFICHPAELWSPCEKGIFFVWLLLSWRSGSGSLQHHLTVAIQIN